jgi:alpha-L-rhamnosidase
MLCPAGALLAPAALTGCGSNRSDTTFGSGWPTAPTTRNYLAASGLLHPVKIVSSSGVATSASNLLNGGAVSLSAVAGTPAVVTIDYGKVVGGLVRFDVSAFSGTPTLTIANSESLDYAASGDATLGFSIASEPSRSVDTVISATGSVTSRLLQGSQRYQTLTLSGSGSATISAFAIDAVLVDPVDSVSSTGYFQCSETLLNNIWDAGAYAVDLNRIREGSIPSPWMLTAAGAEIGPSNHAPYQGGAGWSDMRCSFELTVLAGGASWLLRRSMLSSLMLTLTVSDATTGGSTLTVRSGSIFIGGVNTLVTQPLGQTLVVGTRSLIESVIAGSALSVSIDGTVALTLDLALAGYLPAGSVGFFNLPNHTGLYANLSVLDGAGATLYSNALTSADSGVLTDFLVATNAVPMVTDGAKRERQLFSLDLLAAGQPLYVSSGLTQAMAGGLRLLAAYQDDAGQIASTMDPEASLTPAVANVAPISRWYSLSYAIYYISALHDYVQYSGDTALLAELWPAILRNVSYLKGKTDAQGLIVTDSSNGLDWHPQFGGAFSGAVAQYNIAYYRALLDLAVLATALGDTAQAAAYRQQAAALRLAINTALFNSGIGVYDISDAVRGSVTQDANALAVLYGVAPAGSSAGILKSMATALATTHGRLAFSASTGYAGVISPLASGFELQALFETGATADALGLIRAVWGPMVAAGSNYSGAVWESMTTDAAPLDASVSLAHGWSAAPTGSLSKYVLGVRPVGAGFSTWLFKPQPGALEWASGQVPTPHGAIVVGWSRNADTGAFAAEITVPAGTVATLALPASPAVARLDGKVVTLSASSALDTPLADASLALRYLDNVGPGSHRIELTAA